MVSTIPRILSENAELRVQRTKPPRHCANDYTPAELNVLSSAAHLLLHNFKNISVVQFEL
jgi:hypothetical protein